VVLLFFCGWKWSPGRKGPEEAAWPIYSSRLPYEVPGFPQSNDCPPVTSSITTTDAPQGSELEHTTRTVYEDG